MVDERVGRSVWQFSPIFGGSSAAAGVAVAAAGASVVVVGVCSWASLSGALVATSASGLAMVECDLWSLTAAQCLFSGL